MVGKRKAAGLKQLEEAYDKLTGKDFEQLFSKMAQAVWGDDFEQVKAHGAQGDWGCDGHIISNETIFQGYGHEGSLNASSYLTKITKNFARATDKWPKMKKWVFVHHADGGLPPNCIAKLAELRDENPNLEIVHWPKEMVKKELGEKLSHTGLDDIFGFAPEFQLDLKAEDLKPIFKKLREAANNVSYDPDNTLPDPQKIKLNKFSQIASMNIGISLRFHKIVQDYVLNLPPIVSSKIRNGFVDKYTELKAYGHSSDDILTQLRNYSLSDGTETGSVAALAVVSYYFQSCNIFENE